MHRTAESKRVVELSSCREPAAGGLANTIVAKPVIATVSEGMRWVQEGGEEEV